MSTESYGPAHCIRSLPEPMTSKQPFSETRNVPKRLTAAPNNKVKKDLVPDGHCSTEFSSTCETATKNFLLTCHYKNFGTLFVYCAKRAETDTMDSLFLPPFSSLSLPPQYAFSNKLFLFGSFFMPFNKNLQQTLQIQFFS